MNYVIRPSVDHDITGWFQLCMVPAPDQHMYESRLQHWTLPMVSASDPLNGFTLDLLDFFSLDPLMVVIFTFGWFMLRTLWMVLAVHP